MNTKQLLFFHNVAKTNSIAASARLLDIAQPSISQQLANLEHELGVALLSRSFKGVSLTPAGQIFYEKSQRIMSDITSLKNELKRFSNQTGGRVRIGLLESVGNVISLPLVKEIESLEEGIEIEIASNPSSSITQLLKMNEIDLAITYQQAEPEKGFKSHLLIDENMYLVIGKNNKTQQKYANSDSKTIPFWELSHFDLLTPSSNTSFGKLVSMYERRTGVALRHNRSYSGQLMTGLRQILLSDDAIILPSSAIYHLETERYKCMQIVEPVMPRTIVAISPLASETNMASHKILKLIQSVVRTEHQSGHWQGTLFC